MKNPEVLWNRHKELSDKYKKSNENLMVAEEHIIPIGRETREIKENMKAARRR